jgi:nucleosome binding factor SPN SPT16 subunit
MIIANKDLLLAGRSYKRGDSLEHFIGTPNLTPDVVRRLLKRGSIVDVTEETMLRIVAEREESERIALEKHAAKVEKKRLERINSLTCKLKETKARARELIAQIDDLKKQAPKEE